MNPKWARLGNWLYCWAPALYRPLYGVYKAKSDAAERNWMRSVVTRGMAVVDLGANIGTSTLFLSDLVGPTGTVYAFEPEPRNYAMLARAVRGRDNVRLYNAAVGETSGCAHLYLSSDLNVDHHSYDDGSGRPSIEIPVYRLDDVLADCPRIDFIKSDIQGFELSAFKGAEGILTDNSDVKLLLEVWPWGLSRAGASAEALLDYLRSLGFAIAAIGSSSDRLDLRIDQTWYTNVTASRGRP